MFFQWHNKNSVVQKAVRNAVMSDRFSAAQLKSMGDWWLRVSSAGYIGLLFLIGKQTLSVEGLTGQAAVLALALFMISMLFCWLGLCDCEAAKQKEALEKMRMLTSSCPKGAGKYRPGQCKPCPHTSRCRAYHRRTRL